MYASIRRYKTKKAAEVTSRVKEGFVPLIRKAKGFVSYTAIETGKDEWISISVFKTQAEEEQSNQLAADWLKIGHMTKLASKAKITTGHVVIDECK